MSTSPHQKSVECPKILKYSDLGWSTQNSCFAEKKHIKDLKVWKMPQGWSVLDKLQVQWREKPFEIFRIKFVF